VTQPLVHARGLSVDFPARAQRNRTATAVRALRDVDVGVGPGETVGVVGESGSGKSTLARVLVGLREPTRGTVERHLERDAAAAVAMIFQDPRSSLNPRLSVRALVADPLAVHGVGNRRSRAVRVDELLASVGLASALSGRRARQLSGGQLQRVAIARALALDPELVVADEPTSALDVSIQAQVVNLLRALRDERAFSMLFVSHDMRVVQAIADRVVVMYDGVVVEEGPAGLVYESPRHPYTLLLLASATSLEGARRSRDAQDLLSRPRPLADTSPERLAVGCPFADRCWRATPECLDALPEPRGGRHAFRCLHPIDGGAAAP
jgi:peptide/nickel transport system ATP-binding protein